MDRRSWLFLAAVASVVAAYGAWWFALAASVRAGIAGWIDARRAEGWTIDHGEIETEGFPFRLIVNVAEPKVAAPGFSWSGPMLRGVAKPWDLGHVIVAVEGAQEASLGVGDRRLRFALSAERMRASLRVSRGVLRRGDLDMTNPVLASPDLGGRFAAERLEIHHRANAGETEDRPAGSVDFSLDATGASVPESLGGPLGTAVAAAGLRARLKGEFGASQEALAAWRDAGGSIDLTALKVVWGPLDAGLDATLALDKGWRPLGAGTLRMRGYERTIDAVERAKLLRPVEAQMLRLAMATRAKRDDDPRAFVDLPITAQDGRLFVGPVPVARLQPIFGPGV